MTQADQSDQSADRKGEVRPSKDKNPKPEGRMMTDKEEPRPHAYAKHVD